MENEEECYKLGVPQKTEVMLFGKTGIWGEFLIEKMMLFNTAQELENPEE